MRTWQGTAWQDRTRQRKVPQGSIVDMKHGRRWIEGRLSRPDRAWRGMAGQGLAWRGKARQGSARLSVARQRKVSSSICNTVGGGLKEARLRLGRAWRGAAGHGRTRQRKVQFLHTQKRTFEEC